VRDGKGEKDRVTLLPESLVEPLKQHLERVRAEHERALREGGKPKATARWLSKRPRSRLLRLPLNELLFIKCRNYRCATRRGNFSSPSLTAGPPARANPFQIRNGDSLILIGIERASGNIRAIDRLAQFLFDLFRTQP
jgi:hypothetical protein